MEKLNEYFNGDSLAPGVWSGKYAIKNENTPTDMHRRLARKFAEIELTYKYEKHSKRYNDIHNKLSKYGQERDFLTEDIIFSLFDKFKYIVSQGSIMSQLGSDNIGSLSNCFVIGQPYDSYGGIFMKDQEMVQLMKRRGGVGIDISTLRPIGTLTSNAAKTSTGAISFMERFSNSTREVSQNGRRGALMLSINVNHPDVLDFAIIKRDLSKVTGANISIMLNNEFMKAVDKDEDYILRFPIDINIDNIHNVEELQYNTLIEYESPQNNSKGFIKKIKAKELWNEIVKSARDVAEPGLMFIDNHYEYSPDGLYPQYKGITTNPCITGDTIVSLADGRGRLSIRQLAEEGKDVPVYCLDDNDDIAIRTMRNPRITGYNQPIYKVTIEGGHTIRVTGNHKFKLKNDIYKRADELVRGDSLHIMTRYKASFDDIFKSNSKRSDYMWVNNGRRKNKSEHRLIYEQITGEKIPKGYVIHHKDFNSLNNEIDNLQLMSKVDHDRYHSELIRGDKNPYHKMSDEWKRNFASKPGETNPNYSGVSNEELIEHAKKLTIQLNRRFTLTDWSKYAKSNSLPQHFSKYRQHKLGTITSLAKKVALDLGYEYTDLHPTIKKSYDKALENGYDVTIIDGNVQVKKTCECCNNEFEVSYNMREISFCSTTCSTEYLNSDSDIEKRRRLSNNKNYKENAIINGEKQIQIYNDLKFSLGREPLIKEWINECKNNNTPFRLGTKHGISNYDEIKELAEQYNHKVLSVEIDGYEDVYNGTVDDYHNFFVGEFEEKSKNGKDKYVSINNKQCGEIFMQPYDACRLIAVNLFSFVDYPFTSKAKFNLDKFYKYNYEAQRISDDVVDLEIVHINRIIDKINSDPEPLEVKRTELEMWNKILTTAQNSRRTGLGFTALGDMLAALDLVYDSDEALDMIDSIMNIKMKSELDCITDLAIERGTFSGWNKNIEYNKEGIGNNAFYEMIRLSFPEQYERMLKYGRRNVSWSTVAPTGSVSILTQTTSGLEPLFSPYYMRRKKINPGDENVRVDFVDDNGDSWQEFPVLHPKFKDWMEINYQTLGISYVIDEITKDELDNCFKLSPWYGSIADDIDWVKRVEVQSVIQKYISHSISSTINLPENVSIDDVANIYMESWKKGLKGVTVYRDGSRSGVLITNNNNNPKEIETFNETHAPKRPKRLKSKLVRFNNDKEKWIAFVGLMDGKPYEVFTGLLDNINIPNKIEFGEIVKTKDENGHKVYMFEYEDGSQEISKIFNSDFWNYAKLISGILRHGMPINYAVDLISDMKFQEDHINTWKNGVIRTLKKFIPDGKIGDATCDNCGSNNMVYEEGCLSCKDCGDSRCS